MPLLAPPSVAPAVRPPVAVVPSPWQRLRVTWTGWDGTEWDLTDPRGGVFLTQDSVVGLDKTEETPWVSPTPALPGQFYRGFHAEPNEVVLPVYVYSDVSSAEWLERDRLFWRSLRSGKTGTLRVYAPDGSGHRSLRAVYSSMERGMDRDPVHFGWRRYGISLTAHQPPYWLGEVVYRTFVNRAPEKFFAADHSPAPADPTALLFVSSGSTAASAQIKNSGDTEVGPVYVLNGPIDSGALVGVGDDVTTYDAAISSGRSVVVDMRPATSGVREIATPSGVDVGSDEWMALIDGSVATGTDRYTSIQTDSVLGAVVAEEAVVPLNINFTGQGSVNVAIQPQYERAY